MFVFFCYHICHELKLCVLLSMAEKVRYSYAVVSVYFFFVMHAHSFEWICTKFGTWHPYTLRMFMGLVCAARARALVLHVPFICCCKLVVSFVRKFGTSEPSRLYNCDKWLLCLGLITVLFYNCIEPNLRAVCTLLRECH